MGCGAVYYIMTKNTRKIDPQIHAPVRIDPAYAAQLAAADAIRLANAARLIANMRKAQASKANTVLS